MEPPKSYDIQYLYGYAIIIVNHILDCMTSSAEKVLASLINFLAETPCREKVTLSEISSADWFSISLNTCPPSMLRTMKVNPTSETTC